MHVNGRRDGIINGKAACFIYSSIFLFHHALSILCDDIPHWQIPSDT